MGKGVISFSIANIVTIGGVAFLTIFAINHGLKKAGLEKYAA